MEVVTSAITSQFVVGIKSMDNAANAAWYQQYHVQRFYGF